MLYDTHCHLTQLSSTVLSEQIDLNCCYLSVGTSNRDWLPVLQLAKDHKNIYSAIGLHPWFVDSNYQSQISHLIDLTQHHPLSALGEIGLDFSKNYKSTKSFQIDALEQQLQIAHDNKLPISVHVYKAHSELLTVLKQYNVTGVIHGLGSSLEITKSYLDLGYKIGVNGVLVNDNAVRYHRMIKHFPLQSFVLETDAPNVKLPGFDRTSLNDIYKVLSMFSNLTGLSKDVISQVTSSTAQSIFKF